MTPARIGTLLRLSQVRPDAIIPPIQRDQRSGAITSISPRSRFLFGFPTVSGPHRHTPAMAARPLLPAGVLTRAGLFDAETLPHDWADHDVYLRARQLGTPLYVETGAFVDIDDSCTTSADRPETLSLVEFLSIPRDTRSHRNLRNVAALFRKHYHIPGLYPVGVALYTGRYLLVYLVKRAVYLLGLWRRDRRRMR